MPKYSNNGPHPRMLCLGDSPPVTIRRTSWLFQLEGRFGELFFTGGNSLRICDRVTSRASVKRQFDVCVFPTLGYKRVVVVPTGRIKRLPESLRRRGILDFQGSWVYGVHFCCSSLDDGHSRVWSLGISRNPQWFHTNTLKPVLHSSTLCLCSFTSIFNFLIHDLHFYFFYTLLPVHMTSCVAHTEV